jgi:acetyl esterase/lipase
MEIKRGKCCEKADAIGRMLQAQVNQAAGRTLPANSFEREAPTERRCWGNGHVRINDLSYGTEYPNSWLDVYLPTEEMEHAAPVYLYAHGGGFLFTGKASGDSIAKGTSGSSGLDAFLEELLSQGIAVVSIEYAMAPEYRFPVQIVQMDEAAAWILANAEHYGFDTGKIIIGGGSAGANMTELYAMAVSDNAYAQRLGIEKTALTPSQIACAVIDESALIDYVPTVENAVILEQVWLGEEDLSASEALRISYVPAYIRDKYPPSFVICSNVEEWFYRSTRPLCETLDRAGIENEFFYPSKEIGAFEHGFLMNFKTDPTARECMNALIAFIKKHV